MKKLKLLIISICFRIIDELVDEVIIGSMCQCPKGSLCEFFKLDEDGEELCQYGEI